jgi:hypothetical protein
MAVTKKSSPARKPRAAPARKAAAKPGAKTAAKPVARPGAKPAPGAKATVPVAPPKPTAIPVAKSAKVDKPKKPKLVRDSFTIPKAEYAVLDALKERAARLGRPAKKSELLRAGIKLLAQQGDSALGAALAAVPAIKTGRPKKD